jgi:hypothetical protein
VVATQTFSHPRTSTAERLQAQAEGHHYSTFSRYTPQELRAAIATFLARLPSPEVCWVDEHLLVVVGASRRNQVEPDGPGSGASKAIKGSGPPDQRRARRPGSPQASGRPRADHPVMRPADCWRRPSAERPDRRLGSLARPPARGQVPPTVCDKLKNEPLAATGRSAARHEPSTQRRHLAWASP